MDDFVLNGFVQEESSGNSSSDYFVSNSYRYGFNSMERDDEIYGAGNSVNFTFRMYNTRLGRFMSPDPLIVYGQQYPELSSYQFASNQPIWAIDLEGLQRLIVTTPVLFGQDKTTIRTEEASTVQRRTAEAGVAMRHPQAAARVGVFKSGSTNISSVSSRMARHISSGGNMTTEEGSERNAFRHALWQTMIANEFDAGIARRIGNAHEGIKLAESGHVDFNLPLVQDLQAADEVVDFLNNEIGRNIAASLGENATSLDMAKKVLKVQRDEGLWTVNQTEDGTFSISRTKITQEQYNTGIETLNTLDEHGFNEAERNELQGD